MQGLARLAVLAPVILAVGVLGSAQPARADTAATLYVDQSSAACSDSGPGSQAEPFCTIQAAANVVTAGQTVQIAHNRVLYRESVTIRQSGAPGDPITFTSPGPGATGPIIDPSATSGAALTLADVHDITISGIEVAHTSTLDAIDVLGSHDITLDSLEVGASGPGSGTSSGIIIDGGSAGVTVSRSIIGAGTGTDVRAQPGAQHITLAGNLIVAGTAAPGAVSLSGTSTAVLTGNSVNGRCGFAIAIDGGSSAVVENNFAGLAACSGAPPSAALSVAADSVAGVQADYNAYLATSPDDEYSWGGTSYPTAADFAAATGEGSHDIDMSGLLPGLSEPPENSPLIDSADCSAPGEPATDLTGHPRVDDTLVADSGNGTCHADRGAVERQDTVPLAFTLTPSPSQGPVPFDQSVTITSSATSSWNEPITYTADFGEGSGPVTVPAGGTVSHTYQIPKVYLLTLTATDTDGVRRSTTQQVVAGTSAPPPAALTAQPYVASSPSGSALSPDTASFTVPATSDEWEVASRTITFGDGATGGFGAPGSLTHVYSQPGTYTAALTQTDLLGRTSTATATITVGDGFSEFTPVPDYAAQVGAHKTVKLSVSALNALYDGVHQVALRVEVSSPAASGSLTVYPNGTTRPGTGALHFAARQSASNLVWAKPGTNQLVDFYNGSSGALRLSVFSFGSQNGSYGDTYAPDGPVRVLDTRSGLGAKQGRVPAHGNLSFQAAGSHGIPASAHSVVLNVTTAGGKSAGHLTAYAHGTSNPGTPDVTWATGQTRTGLVIVPLTDGKVALHNSSSGSVNVFADAVGYYNSGGTGSVFLPAASRIASATIGPKRSLKVQAGGIAGLPGTGISAVAVNLTASGATAHGSVTGYPDGASLPAARVLSYQAARTTAVAAIIPAGGDGAIRLYNDSASPVTVRVDLTGAYYQYPGLP